MPKEDASSEQHGATGNEGVDEGPGASVSVVASGQFVIGSWLWVVGQQVGSLACTGLGYWIVFDALGVVIGNVVPKWLRSTEGEKEKVRRPYGWVHVLIFVCVRASNLRIRNARCETVLMFAQAVYLMFSSVYVCKETVEHLLLNAGPSGEKHHHHYHTSDDDGVLG